MTDNHVTEAEFGRNGKDERRGKRRFRIEQEVRYRLLYGHRIAETGVGRTVDISSNGVWMTTQTQLNPGLPVELSIAWPALLNDVCPMKLVIYGCIMRSTPDGAAVAIERYEFRTQGRPAFQQPVQPVQELRPAMF